MITTFAPRQLKGRCLAGCLQNLASESPARAEAFSVSRADEPSRLSSGRRNEIAGHPEEWPHSITSSARSTTVCGKVRPSARGAEVHRHQPKRERRKCSQMPG
jgi:hypothetical protein